MVILDPNEKHEWKQSLRELTGYSLQNMRECVQDVYDLHCKKEFCKTYDCADQVYSHRNFMGVAKLNPVALFPGFEIFVIDKQNRRICNIMKYSLIVTTILSNLFLYLVRKLSRDPNLHCVESHALAPPLLNESKQNRWNREGLQLEYEESQSSLSTFYEVSFGHVIFLFTTQRMHIGHDTVTRMRSLYPSICLYPCFENEYF